MFSNFFSPKSCRLSDNVLKYCRAGKATDDNIIRRTVIACWITKDTDRHTEYVMLMDFPLHKSLHILYIVMYLL
jgi:hypothetical protein